MLCSVVVVGGHNVKLRRALIELRYANDFSVLFYLQLAATLKLFDSSSTS